jgi:hypothetical protein
MELLVLGEKDRGAMAKNIKSKLGITAVGFPLSGIGSYFVQKVLESWGALDPFAKWLGGWLKVNVTLSQAGWTVGLLAFLVFYGGVLWIVWQRPMHVHHMGKIAETMPEAAPKVEAIRAPQIEQNHSGSGNNIVGDTVLIGSGENG